MKNYRQILFVLMLFIGTNAYSQLGVTGYLTSVYGEYYDFEIKPAFGINYNFTNRLKSEIKVHPFADEFSFDIELGYRFINKEVYSLYGGLGVNIYPFSGFDNIGSMNIPVGVELSPIRNHRNISFVLEISTRFNEEFWFYQFAGVRYTFKWK